MAKKHHQKLGSAEAGGQAPKYASAWASQLYWEPPTL